MATLTFKLRDNSIRLIFSYGKTNRLRYTTGLKVEKSKNWDDRKMRVKNTLAEINKDIINEKLDDAQSEFNKRYTELSLDSEIEVNNDLLREVADEIFNKKTNIEVKEKKELLSFFKWYLEYYSAQPVSTTGQPLTKGTIKTYRNTLSILERFSKEEYRLRFDKITLTFYEDFIEWLYNKKYSTNYIGTIIKILKTIMNVAFERELHKNIDYKKKGFKKPTEEIDNIYLDSEELIKFKEADLSSIHLLITESGVRLDREKIERARDLFLISAYTGLRVGDFNRLSSENFHKRNGKDYLVITTSKTNKTIAVPIHPVLKEILQKRNGNPPPKLPEQHINYAIKKVAEKADIDSLVKKSRTIAGKKVTKEHKKYELVTNHTGRRSFCTNAYLSGMATIDIMTISGHSSERVFLNYIKADHLQKAEKISDHPFFKGS